MIPDLTRLIEWLGRMEVIYKLTGEWRQLSTKPFSNFKKLTDLEQRIGAQLVELTREEASK